ncbi:glycosyltransferase family 2 protein [Stutzerimonas stutzeri]
MLSVLYHERLATGDKVSSLEALELALQTPGYQDEALVWKSLLALRDDKQPEAFLSLATASARFPERAELKALLARCLGAFASPQTVDYFLRAALKSFPVEPELRRQYWLNRQALCSADELTAELQGQLAYIEDPTELRLVLGLLANCSSQAYGVVRYDHSQSALVGWAVDLQDPFRIPVLRLEAGPGRAEFPADQPSALLASAGLPSGYGGIFVKLPRPLECLNVSFSGGGQLIGSPVAAIAPFEAPASVDGDPAQQPVDILLPVYKGTEATLACLASLLRSSQKNRTPHRVIVLDDSSPDPVLASALERYARNGSITYIRRPANLGFIRNMNRGMALNPASDVVWLNADTLVHGDWLDRLRNTAYLGQNVASVTPWSNNGELMSFPQSRVCHPMPSAKRHAKVDRLARKSGLAPVEIEVGCGFCLYIKRDALNDIGYLDELELQRGYGEESDWCLRARSKGWRHLGATNVFVAHAGGQSFGPEKALRVFQNNAVLRRRYPDAERRFDAFVARDPLRPARETLQNLIDRELGRIGATENRSDSRESSRLQANTDKNPRKTAAATAGASLLVKEDVSLQPPSLSLPGQCWLIADRLDNPGIGEQWLALARQLARQRQPISLLLIEESPWEVQLLATGRINRLPVVDGLDPLQVLPLCGTSLALSLDETSRASKDACYSVQLAANHQLPLYAPQTSGLSALGALTLDRLLPYINVPACA